MMRRLIVAGAVAAAVLLPAAAASAHPLGNFTVNHYDGLTVHPDSLADAVVIDAAEIPTAQAKSSVDVNHDGVVDVGEAAAYARRMCRTVAADVRVVAGGTLHPMSVVASRFGYRPGAAGLPTSRLECDLVASVHVRGRTLVSVSDGYASDRIGWREFTAAAAGVHLVDAPVPARSISDELRHYPNDLLTSPLDVRSAQLTVLPGAGTSTVGHIRGVSGAGPFSRLVGALDRGFGSLAGHRHLTVAVALLAVLVSLLLGAAHALLPGHGKTVMAAYLAGKRGTPRDAVVVGATVTITHTAGVLLLGLALSVSSSLAGERVDQLLGVVSGLLIIGVGGWLLRDVVRHRRHRSTHEHDHAHDHTHGHGHDHHHDHAGRPGRGALVGMGLAGGLVPSPSALVVLLGAVALGRTVFGVLLVLVYGVGMAATLTGAGLLLVGATERLRRRPRLSGWLDRRTAAVPTMTAAVVVVVGISLATRSVIAL